MIDGDGSGGGGDAEAGAADGDAAEAEGAAEASRTACVAAIAAGRRPFLESLLACCNDEPAAEAMEVDTPAAAAGDDLRLPAAHSICLALRAAHVAAAADAERGAVVVTAASDANLFRSALATVGKVLLAAAADADADRRHGAAPLAVDISSRLRAALTPESMAPLPLGREHVEAAVHSPLLAAFAFAEAGVDDRAAATLPAVARAVGGLCASPGGWAEGAGALRGVIQTRLRAAVGGGDAHALRAVCASVQALTAAPPAQMSAVTKWLVPDLHSLAAGGDGAAAANLRRLLLFAAPLWAKLAATPASPSLLTAVADYVLAEASSEEGRLAAAAPVLLIALVHAPNSTPLPPALLPRARRRARRGHRSGGGGRAAARLARRDAARAGCIP